MIEFYLDTRSGVPTYLQLVQQVHQAVRLGILLPGDQLPTVKEVVASLAINPNTVLKAYRELDHDRARRGPPRPGDVRLERTPIPPTRRGEGAPVRTAALDRARPRRRSRRREHGGALCRLGAATGVVEGGVTDVHAVTADGLGKRYGSHWALRDCTFELPAGTVTALVGPNGAGKTTLLQLAVGLTRAERRRGSRLRPVAARRCVGRPPSRRFRRAGAPALPQLQRRARC